MIGKQHSIVELPTPGKQDKFTCICCRIKFDSTNLQRLHFKSEWHLYNLKRKICLLEPIDLDDFNDIQLLAKLDAQTKDDDDIDYDNMSIISSICPSKRVLSHSDDDWEEVNADELLDADYNDEEIDQMLSKVVKSTKCLFCDKENLNIKKNLDHMNSNHGFFIPEEKYLIDLEGLMEYLGFKVGAGSTCLWCNKQFSTIQGVRLHMINKDHCKILYDQGKAVEEFKEFYDYSEQEIFEMKPANQLAVPMRRYEKRQRQNRQLARIRSVSDSEQLVANNRGSRNNYIAGSLQAKSIKKFDAYRAKIVLRTQASNNETKRSRLRKQNPI